mmetsp:Transcript_30481/g.45142  ORF Transcript_30481/g.45142 Transcript_30481/m.45142 type:complete len:235 (+) Transcript_30481:431-1135(+)
MPLSDSSWESLVNRELTPGAHESSVSVDPIEIKPSPEVFSGASIPRKVTFVRNLKAPPLLTRWVSSNVLVSMLMAVLVPSGAGVSSDGAKGNSVSDGSKKVPSSEEESRSLGSSFGDLLAVSAAFSTEVYEKEREMGRKGNGPKRRCINGFDDCARSARGVLLLGGSNCAVFPSSQRSIDTASFFITSESSSVSSNGFASPPCFTFVSLLFTTGFSFSWLDAMDSDEATSCSCS